MLAVAYVVAILLFLYLPVAVIVLFSFANSPRLSLPIEGLTLDWYRRAFDNPLMTLALSNSLLLALVSAVVGGVFGTAFAFGLVRLRGSRLGAPCSRQTSPGGRSTAGDRHRARCVLQRARPGAGLANAAVGHVLVCLPFVVLTMNARLERFDFAVLEAARDLGASPLRAFLDITFPLIRPSILGSALLAAALSLDEFVVTWFNIGSQQTLPVLVWGLMRRGVDPSINAVASILLLSLIVLLGLSSISWRGRFR